MSTAVLHDLPMPARLAPWPPASRTTLQRCLWLALLLHLWAVLWLGSAPEGTAPPGQGVQGRLNVTLRGPSDDGLPSAPPPQAGPATAAEAPPRLGGRVRETPLPPDAPPGAAVVGAVPVQPPATMPAPEPALRTLVPVPAAPAAAAVERALTAPPPAPTPFPTPGPAPVPDAPVLPAMPPLPQLAPLPPATAAPPSEGRIDAAALRALLPTPAPPLVAPAPVERPALPAAALPTLGAALAPPAPAAERAPAPAPAAAPAPAPASPSAPAPAPAPAPATAGAAAPTTAPMPAAVPTASVGAAPTTAPVPAAPTPIDAGPRLGADVAVPAAAASAPKRLNLELGRLRGGELSRHGSNGVLPVLPRPPETDKLAAEIEKAGRADCRTAHAGAGILAVVPLAVDAMRGKGCKW